MTTIFKRLVSAICFLLPSGLSCLLFRSVGHKIGKNCRLPIFSYVFAERLKLGNDVDIRPFVFISVSQCMIGNSTIISYGAQIIGSKGFYTKDNCIVGPHCIIHCEENVSLGFYSGLGARCIVYSHGSFLPVCKGYPAKFAEIVLEDFVWTAVGVLILPGSHVESNCIINAGVVVNARVPSGTLLQIDAKQFQKLDLNKLIGFAKRDNWYYHQKMITSFLSLMKIEYTISPERNLFQCSNGYQIKSDPDKNTIALYLRGKDQPIIYDLENYYCDNSSDKIHKAFVPFLRLRYGITLRVNYSGVLPTAGK
jgi:acetyltransferase-like isoleucine patch superfamily enzyme